MDALSKVMDKVKEEVKSHPEMVEKVKGEVKSLADALHLRKHGKPSDLPSFPRTEIGDFFLHPQSNC
jgi:hypothetical protein